MADGPGIIQEIELALSAASVQKLKADTQAALKAGTDPTQAKKNLDEVDQGLKKVHESGLNVQRLLERIGIYFGVYEIASTIKNLAKEIVGAGIEFEKLRAELQVFTGDAKSAADVLRTLEEISKTQPFTVRDLTTAYTTLRNVGITPTTEQFKNIANVAAGLNKPIGEVALTIAQSTLGMTRGLRTLGIQAVATGDTLKLTFRGTTTEITNNAASILDYMDKLGANKFGDASAGQLNTLAGAWGQFTKVIDRAFESIGEAGLTGALTTAVKGLTTWVSGITDGSDKANTFRLNVQYSIDMVKLFGLIAAATAQTVVGSIAFMIRGVEELGRAILGAAKVITGDWVGAMTEMRKANDLGLQAQAFGSGIGDAWKRAFGFASEADARLAQNQVRAAGFDLAVQWNKGITDGLTVGPTASVRAAFGLGGPNAAPGTRDSLGATMNSLGAPHAGTNIIPGIGGDSADKVLDAQKQLLAELIKEVDERAKIAGITNKEIDDYSRRLALVKQEQAVLGQQETLLTKTLTTGQMSDEARKATVEKLTTMVHQSKALMDEAARLLSFMSLRQPLAANNANNLPGMGGGLNAGVDAANQGGAGIMGLHGGMTPDQRDAVGALTDDAQRAKVDQMTASIHKWGDAWFQSFQAMGAGKNVLKELEKATGATLSMLAQAFAEIEIGKAAADFAEGAWPPNPAALAAGFKHLAAAALFEAAAGFVGNLGGGGGGGGSSAGGAGSNPTGLNTVETRTDSIAQRQQHAIQITVNAFDPNNPIDQNLLAQALQPAIERSGKTYIIGTR